MRFAPIEWEEAPGVADPALARTWCRFEIAAGTRRVSWCADPRAESERAGVFGSLLPVSEWLLDRWFDVLEDRREPIGTSESDWDWRGRHAWRGGREGLAFPDLLTFRSDDGVVFRWMQDARPAASEVEFIGSGEVTVAPSEAERSLSDLLDEVARRLRAATDERSAEFRSARESLRSMSPAERARRAIIARLGLEMDALDEGLRELVTGLAGGDRDPVTEELVDGADVAHWTAASAWGREVWSACRASAPAAGDLLALRERVRGSDSARLGRPWETGWERARALRAAVKELAPNGGRPSDALSGWMTRWCEAGAMTVTHATGPIPAELDAFVAWDARKAPVIAFSKRRAGASRTFRLARELHDILYGASADRPSARLASAPRRRRLSRANAFAAELLAPAEVIRGHLRGAAWADEAAIESLSAQLDVHPLLLRHQIENHRIAALALEP